MKWGASVARCPPNPVVAPLGGYSKCLIIVGICRSGPITAEPCRAKTASLLRTSILFRPHRYGPRGPKERWWRRRVPPPGPLRLFHEAFIAIVGFPTPLI